MKTTSLKVASSGSHDPTNEQNSSQVLANINRDAEDKEAQQKAKELNIPFVDVARFPLNPDVLKVMTLEEAQKAVVMPFYKTGKTYRFALADPINADTKALIEAMVAKGFTIEQYIASRSSIAEGQKWYASNQKRGD